MKLRRWFLFPAWLWMILLLAAPMAIVVAYSFLTRGIYGGIGGPWTFESYRRLVDPLYLSIYFRSLVMAAAYVGAAAATGTGGELLRVDGRSLGYIILSAIIGGVAGLFVYFHALKLGDAAVVVPITATYPLATALFAVLFLGEPLTPSRILGALLIVAGVYFVR